MIQRKQKSISNILFKLYLKVKLKIQMLNQQIKVKNIKLLMILNSYRLQILTIYTQQMKPYAMKCSYTKLFYIYFKIKNLNSHTQSLIPYQKRNIILLTPFH